MIETTDYDSPIGKLRFAVRDGKLCALVPAKLWTGPEGAPATGDDLGVVAALDRYLAGDVAALDDVEVELNGTSFQNAAWRAMRDIKPGSTTNYLAPCGLSALPADRSHVPRRALPSCST